MVGGLHTREKERVNRSLPAPYPLSIPEAKKKSLFDLDFAVKSQRLRLNFPPSVSLHQKEEGC